MKINIFFSLEIPKNVDKGSPLYHLPFEQRVQKVIFLKYPSESKLFGLFIKYTINKEFNIFQINIFFSLESLKKVDKSHPFVSSSFQTEGSKSNFFRDIRAKVNSLDSL